MRHASYILGLILSATAIGGLCSCALAQSYSYAPYQPPYQSYPQYAPPAPPVALGVPEPAVTLTADQLDQLVAPIALYPDPLLAQIFPAATFPDEVAAAEQWLQTTPNPTEDAIDAQDWDPSIKALTHYPTVLQMMANDLDWTAALGAAFLNQQQDVLDAVQRFRAQAQAAGNLQTNQQEQIVADGGDILIEPADPNVICVPEYDPNLVCVQQSPITFGVEFPIGLWLDNGFDWQHHWIDHGGGWYEGWKHPAQWDRNPPKWDVHPRGYQAPAPKQWVRESNRPAPRMTPEVANRALSRSGAAARGRPPAPIPVRPQPAVPAVAPRNAFDGYQNRADVQHADQRAHQPNPPAPHAAPGPAAAPPHEAPHEAPPAAAPPHEAPHEAPPAAAPPHEAPHEAPPAAAPPHEAPHEAPPAAAPPPPPAHQAPPNGAFNGGSGNDARANSQRGHASAHQ